MDFVRGGGDRSRAWSPDPSYLQRGTLSGRTLLCESSAVYLMVNSADSHSWYWEAALWFDEQGEKSGPLLDSDERNGEKVSNAFRILF